MNNIQPKSSHACEDCLRNKYGYSFAVHSVAEVSKGNYAECPDCREKDFLLEHSMFRPHGVR